MEPKRVLLMLKWDTKLINLENTAQILLIIESKKTKDKILIWQN